ncbi:prepilin-type N-terminal cleavage/methylation domain-containing protein [Escherichia coli]|nr:prepilin-type N-terminal cleavage/methylation domain-containing protein [Escherichia coli]
MNKHNKEGFSLLELLLVLGIVSALIISAFII